MVVLVGQKEGHMIRYGQKEKERRKKWEKYTVKKKKTIVIGYAYLSQGKHIANDQNRLVGNQRTKEEPKQRQKRWKTNSENRTNQEVPDRMRTEVEAMAVDGWGDSKNEFVLFSFCERQFSTLTSYWRTTWVDNMNANKIRKKKH